MMIQLLVGSSRFYKKEEDGAAEIRSSELLSSAIMAVELTC